MNTSNELKVDGLSYTKFGNIAVESSPLLAPVSTQRNLKLPRVLRWYTKDELEVLLDKPPKEFKSTRFDELYKETEESLKGTSYHRFTEAEDLFIKNNYQYLSDTTIALALNVPVKKVHARRRRLGLFKKQRSGDDVMLIIWDKRGNYERDLKQRGSIMLRPNIKEGYE